MRIVSFLFLSFVLVSCASRKAGWEKETTSVKMSSSELSSLKKDALSFWDKRAETEKLKRSLILF